MECVGVFREVFVECVGHASSVWDVWGEYEGSM